MQIRKALAAAAVAALFAGSAIAAPVTTEGTGVGKHGDVTVAVTFDGGKITDIKIVKEQENKVLAKGVYTDLKDHVIATNSADLDVISGATFLPYPLLVIMGNFFCYRFSYLFYSILTL